MSSVLVRGMEMPKSCDDCPLNYDQMACAVTGTRWWSDRMMLMDFDSDKERLYDCPLIEVKKPHGRLGDLDALYATINEADDYGADMADILRLILQADTIIGAEGRK